MSYSVVTRVEVPRPLAVISEEMPLAEVPLRFAGMLDRVYAAARSLGVALDGQNVFVYRGLVPQHVDVEIGVGVGAAFEGRDGVECSMLPGGLVATTAHYGAYEELGAAHAAIASWATASGEKLEGTRWEVYGHHEDDPTRRRTDVFYLLVPRPQELQGKRVAFGVAGVALMVLACMVTLGTALLAPLGMAGAHWFVRRNGGTFTRAMSWWGAVIAANVVIVIFAAVSLFSAPNGMLSTITNAADSASVQSRNTPPPAWLEKIAPGTAARARAGPAASPGVTKAFAVWAAVVGGVIACALFALLIGTAGWLPSLLLIYAFTGRWLQSKNGVRSG